MTNATLAADLRSLAGELIADGNWAQDYVEILNAAADKLDPPAKPEPTDLVELWHLKCKHMGVRLEGIFSAAVLDEVMDNIYGTNIEQFGCIFERRPVTKLEAWD